MEATFEPRMEPQAKKTKMVPIYNNISYGSGGREIQNVYEEKDEATSPICDPGEVDLS